MDAVAVFLLYIGKVSLCLALLYFSFKLFLCNETFFRLNRRVLIVGTIANFVLPLIEINLPESIAGHSPFVAVYQMFEEKTADTLIAQPAATADQGFVPTADRVYNPFSILLILFLLGVVINSVYLIKSFCSIGRVIRNGEKKKIGMHDLIVVSGDISPFSWYKYIVVSESDYLNNREEIIAHEMAHINHRHTYDILLYELLTLLQWFNPVMWLLKKELKDVHEYQADSSALHSGIDATKYQLLLVKKAVGSSSYTLANSLYHSKIKKRITMMLKKRSKKCGRLKLLALLPAATMALYAFAQPVPTAIEPKSGVEEEVGFSFPLKNKTKVASPFGIRNRAGKNLYHYGVDLKGMPQDTIYAFASGTVILSERDNKFGNYVRLKHADGLETVYAHNSRNLVEVNEKVTTGQPIAIIGNTGYSTGIHLHFEVWKDGEAVDPMGFFENK